MVEYYPSQDLAGAVIVINWPYSILVHHYEKLHEFKSSCETKGPTDLCVRERDASEHIDLLLRFLDDNIMEHVRAEEERFKKSYITFENFWLFYKPGRTIIEMDTHKQWNSYVVSSITGGIFENPVAPWTMHAWRLAFDGEDLGRVAYTQIIGPSSGEIEWQRHTHFVDDWEKIEGDESTKLVRDGEKYWKLQKK